MQGRGGTIMKARFFCESCGAEVRHSETVCPSCGKTFTAVRCPRCGFEGGAKQFARGCHGCGYLNVIPPSVEKAVQRPAGAPRSSVRGFSLPALKLPARFYRIALVLLAVLLLGLVVLLVGIVAGR
jgi:hypothetical protein